MLLNWLASLRRALSLRATKTTLNRTDRGVKKTTPRSLRFEPLEERRLLSATPFGTPFAGDTTGDGADELVLPIPGSDTVQNVDVGNMSVLFGVPERNNVSGFEPGVTNLFNAQYAQSGEDTSGGQADHWTAGSAWTMADFDNDGLDDLAIGVPGANAQAGEVRVLYSARTTDANPLNDEEVLSQDTVIGGVEVADNSEPVDRFGETLISGDFDGNGVADLVIGAPLEDLVVHGQITFNAGAVHVVYSRDTPGFGLDPGVSRDVPDNQFITMNDTSHGAAGEEDRFGSAFAVGRFNDDDIDDLAIGIPGRTGLEGEDDAGAVLVVFGSADGLDLSKADIIRRTDTGFIQGLANDPIRPMLSTEGDRFGTALAAGDINANGIDELVVGAPFAETFDLYQNIPTDAGMVHVFEALEVERPEDQNAPESFQLNSVRSYRDENAQPGAYFGFSVTVGNYDTNSRDDVVIGSPGHDVTIGNQTFRDAGQVSGFRNNQERRAFALTLGDLSFAGGVQENAYFGATLWTGNFNGGELVVDAGTDVTRDDNQLVGEWQFTGDGSTSNGPVNLPSRDRFDDLVVGIPLYDEPGTLDAGQDAGAVQVFYGSSNGLVRSIGQHITLNGIETQRSTSANPTVEHIQGTPKRGENLGGNSQYPYFTPVKMIAPLTGESGVDWSITGFVDLDPDSGVANFLGNEDRVTDGSRGTTYLVHGEAGASLVAPTDGTVLPASTEDADTVTIDFGDGWHGEFVLGGSAPLVSTGESVSAGDVIAQLVQGQSVTIELHYQSFDGEPTSVIVDPYLNQHEYFAIDQDLSAAPPIGDSGNGDGTPTDMTNSLDGVDQFYVYDHYEFAVTPANTPAENLIIGADKDAGPNRVQLHSGEYVERDTDLSIPGRGIDWSFNRTYRSGANFETALGQSWDFSDNRRIGEVTETNIERLRQTYSKIQIGDVVRLDGQGRMDLYRLQEDGSYESPAEFYTALEKLEDGTFRERDQHGNVAAYDTINEAGVGRVRSITDRNENSLNYTYDEFGRLDQVIDTLGRAVTYSYNNGGLISQVEDFAGRVLSFDYDANRDLVAVTSPTVDDTSTGNDFLHGRTTRYVYSSGHEDARLNHNLLEVIRPNEVAVGQQSGDFTPYVQLVYGENDRVESQTLGGTNLNGIEAGGVITYSYTDGRQPHPESPADVFHQLEVTDAADNLTRYDFNVLGNVLRVEEFTNRDVRPDDPTSYITRYEYNIDGELVRTINPEGDQISHSFSMADDRFQQGNAVRTVQFQANRRADQRELITQRGFEPIYNQVRSVTDPRAFDPDHEAAIVVDGLANIDRYTTEWFFDYQESDERYADAALAGTVDGTSTLLIVDQNVLTTEVLLIQELGLSEDAPGLKELRERLASAGVELGLGDLNADGDTSAVVAGNIVRIEYPTVHLLDGGNQAAVEGDRQQEIVELKRYNRFGQMTSEVDAEGNLMTYEYYAEQNPNSFFDELDNQDGATDTGGYLRRVVVDADPESFGPTQLSDDNLTPLAADRNSSSGALPTHVQSHLEYDSVGNVIRSVDGRGMVTAYEVNALNEVVSINSAADHGFWAPGVFDASEPLELQDFAYQQRFFYDHNGNVVLEQVEDRGNTSGVDGNLPDDDLSKHFFVERGRSTGFNSPRLLADDNAEWDMNRYLGMLVRIEEGAGAGQVRTIIGNSHNMLFPDEAWDDIPDATSVYAILPNPDAPDAEASTPAYRIPSFRAGAEAPRGTAYVDTAYEYDILDNRIETVQEVSNDSTTAANKTGAANDPGSSQDGHFLRTSLRYDRNGNHVLTIKPEGNAVAHIHDERDLLFQTVTGATEAPEAALMASDYRDSFDVRGGEASRSATYYVDGNRKVVAVVDAEDTDRDTTNNLQTSPTKVAQVGDAVRYRYDAFDRLVETTDAMGNQTINTYDAANNIVRVARMGDSVDDEVGHQDNVMLENTEYGYDELNRLVVTNQVLFKTPNVRTVRDIDLTDTDAMDRLLEQSVKSELQDQARVPRMDAFAQPIVGRVSTITEYDRNSRLTFTVEDDLVTRRREYDGAGRVIKTTDSVLDNGFREQTDEAGNIVRSEFQPEFLDGNTVEYAYDDNSNVVEQLETDVTDLFLVEDEQFRTTYYYDGLNRLQTSVDNIGQTTDYRYDSRDNLVAMSDGNGPQVKFSQPRAIHRRGLGNTDAIANTNYFGNVTLYAYDGISRQTMTERLLTENGLGDGHHIGATLEGVPTLRPMVDSMQGGGDGIIRNAITYDDNSNVSGLVDDNGNVSLRLYDNQDRLVTVTEGLNVRTDLSEDLILGDRVVVTNTVMTLGATHQGIDEALLDAQIAQAEARLDVIAPGFGQADHVHDNPPTTVVFGYSLDGNVVYVEDENDTETFNFHDANNRKVAVRVFRAGQFDRHSDDRVYTAFPIRDFSNYTDPDNTPVVVGTTKQNFTYDGLNRLTAATDNNDPESSSDDTRVSLAYDSLSRIVEETQQTGSRDRRVVSSDWNADDRRVGVTYANGRELSFAYDTLDRVEDIRDVPVDDPTRITTPLVHYDYIGTDRVLTRAHQNGTKSTMLSPDGIIAGHDDIGYDGLRRVVEVRDVRGLNNVITGYQRTYDRADNVTSEAKLHSTANSELYAYDSAYQLTDLDRGVLHEDATLIAMRSDTLIPGEQDWTLDGVGNWQTVDGEARAHSSFNEVVTRTEDGRMVTLSYDDNGNLTRDGSHRYEYDFRDRLVRVTNSRADEVGSYAFDALDRRVLADARISRTLTETTEFIHDGQRVIEGRDADQVLQGQYVYGIGIDEVVVLDRNLDEDDSAVDVDDQRLFYHSSPLGSVHALTDASGNTVEGYQYDAYGRPTVFVAGANGSVDFGGDDSIVIGGSSDVDNPYLFTGRRLDAETGLYYYRARHLDVDLGRFLQRHPIGTWADVDSLGNAYWYVANHPVTNVDPFGK